MWFNMWVKYAEQHRVSEYRRSNVQCFIMGQCSEIIVENNFDGDIVFNQVLGCFSAYVLAIR